MGATASTPNAGHSSLPPRRALHVLRVAPGSPAANTDITPFFDFLVGVRGLETVDIDAASLERVVEAREGTEIELIVWSSKVHQTRTVSLIPSRIWASGLPPPPDAKPSLLGLSMRLCTPEFSLDNVWHVLDVHEGSPAESAGLVPYGDYIIGYSGGVLERESDFYELVEAHVDKPLRVYVYSHDFDNLREVVLVPNRMWGGQGLLGCGVGFGLLHRIPTDRSRLLPVGSTPGPASPSVPTPAQNHVDTEEAQLFVPAGDASADPNLWYGDRQGARYGYGQGLYEQAQGQGGYAQEQVGYGDDPYGYDDGHGHSHGEHGHSHGDHGHSHDDHGHSHGDHGHSHGDDGHSGHGHSHDQSHSHGNGYHDHDHGEADNGPQTPIPGQTYQIPSSQSVARSFGSMNVGLGGASTRGPVFSGSYGGAGAPHARDDDADTTTSGRTGPNAVGGSITSVDD